MTQEDCIYSSLIETLRPSDSFDTIGTACAGCEGKKPDIDEPCTYSINGDSWTPKTRVMMSSYAISEFTARFSFKAREEYGLLAKGAAKRMIKHYEGRE
jgi:hypothetical protein